LLDLKSLSYFEWFTHNTKALFVPKFNHPSRLVKAKKSPKPAGGETARNRRWMAWGQRSGLVLLDVDPGLAQTHQQVSNLAGQLH